MKKTIILIIGAGVSLASVASLANSCDLVVVDSFEEVEKSYHVQDLSSIVEEFELVKAKDFDLLVVDLEFFGVDRFVIYGVYDSHPVEFKGQGGRSPPNVSMTNSLHNQGDQPESPLTNS